MRVRTTYLNPSLDFSGLFEIEHRVSAKSIDFTRVPVWGGSRKGQRTRTALHELAAWLDSQT